MNVLWLCNIILPSIAQSIGRPSVNIGGWLSGLSDSLTRHEDIQLTICFPVESSSDAINGSAGNLNYYGFPVSGNCEKHFTKILRQLKPDVINIFGTEFKRSLDMVNACRSEDLTDRMIIHIQGLVSVCCRHYFADLFLGELASCKFISEMKNVVMIGNPGRGKTHMAIGLGLKACALGMSVLFKNAATLSTELAEAKDNYILGKLEKRIRQADLLILDEMSYVSFDRFQSELLFKAVSDRSERGSIIVTTNLPFSQWTELFENTAMVAALVDRLTFKSYVLDMNGDSYRLDQTLKTQHS